MIYSDINDFVFITCLNEYINPSQDKGGKIKFDEQTAGLTMWSFIGTTLLYFLIFL